MVDKAVRERVKWIISGLDFDKLTDWEEKFMESVERNLDFGVGPTGKQMDKLEEVYREKG
jgi:hypothetical protein